MMALKSIAFVKLKFRNFIYLLFILILLFWFIGFVEAVFDEKEKLKAEQLPLCIACVTLVNSFKKGFDRTSRFKFEGGDALWEEKNQGKYAQSEVRLVEIQEEMCKEVIKGQQQCMNLLAEHEELLEQWWIKHQESVQLYDWLCINELKVCCPNNSYGKDCLPCPGGTEKPCNGNGKCKGAGTRKGNGQCQCHRGYAGEICDTCDNGFYEVESEDQVGKKICEECHKSCQGHCRESGPKGCEVCKEGWLYHSEFGCQDIDECISSQPCKSQTDTFCANTEGSYMCAACFKGCATCVGDGPDLCNSCIDGYTFKDGFCIDNETRWRSIHMMAARYLTYLGLCIATFIIFRKSTVIAGCIGLAVAIYIGMSEYTVNDSLLPFEIRTATRT